MAALGGTTTLPHVAGFVAMIEPGPVIVFAIVVTLILVLSMVLGSGRFPRRTLPRDTDPGRAQAPFTDGS